MPLFFNRGTLTFSKKIFQKERAGPRKPKKEPEVSKPSGFVIEDDLDGQDRGPAL
jgi:hypothetical protein